MPKKGKKPKKKSTVVKPEINIVEGESSFAVEDMIRMKKEKEEAEAAAAATVTVSGPSIEIGVEAAEDVMSNTVANNFSVTEVTEMRRMESLSVIGKQSSINSNFSFFSDNNLTERDDLEEIEDHQFSHGQTTVTSFVSESNVVSSRTTFTTNIVSPNPIDGGESSLEIEELEDDKSISSDEEMTVTEADKTTVMSRFTDQSEERDNFLGDLEDEILDSESSASEEERISIDETKGIEQQGPKSKISWDNVLFKKKIHIELKSEDMNSSRDTGPINENGSTWEQMFVQLRGNINEKSLIENFSDASLKFIDHENGFGMVSSIQRDQRIEIQDPRDFSFNIEEFGLQAYSDVYGINNSLGYVSLFLILRHFLIVPQLTEADLSEMKVFAYNLENQQSTLLKPTAITEKYVIVNANNFTNFMLVSENRNLPISVVLVPFQAVDEDMKTLYIMASVTGFQYLSKITREHPKLKKCGYEKQICLLNNAEYTLKLFGFVKTLVIETNKSFHNTMAIETSAQETIDYLEIALTNEEKIEVSTTISLYDKLRVVEEAPSYTVKSLPRVDLGNIEMCKPAYGSTNSLEPLLSGIREGNISEANIQELLNTLGLTMNDKSLEYGNGEQAPVSLKDVAEALENADLNNIADEIINKLTWSSFL